MMGWYGRKPTTAWHLWEDPAGARYAYVENNPVNHRDSNGHCQDERQCEAWLNRWTPDKTIYYLNGLGGAETIEPSETANGEYQYLLYVLNSEFSDSNVHHVPVFTDGYTKGISQLEMYGEAVGFRKPETNKALNSIKENPPGYGDEVIIVGSSAGGTVAAELLDLLDSENIFVDKLILRGSPVNELILNNVGEVHYLTGDPPRSDWYYSFDVNPFDGVEVEEHLITGLSVHNPTELENAREVLSTIGETITGIINN